MGKFPSFFGQEKVKESCFSIHGITGKCLARAGLECRPLFHPSLTHPVPFFSRASLSFTHSMQTWCSKHPACVMLDTSPRRHVIICLPGSTSWSGVYHAFHMHPVQLCGSIARPRLACDAGHLTVLLSRIPCRHGVRTPGQGLLVNLRASPSFSRAGVVFERPAKVCLLCWTPHHSVLMHPA